MGILQARILAVNGIFPARVLEWVAVPFSRGSSNPGTESEATQRGGKTLGQKLGPLLVLLVPLASYRA